MRAISYTRYDTYLYETHRVFHDMTTLCKMVCPEELRSVNHAAENASGDMEDGEEEEEEKEEEEDEG